MTDYVFAPATTTNPELSWSDPTIWNGGVVPAGTDADVLVPTADARVSVITLAAGDATEIGSLVVGQEDLDLAAPLTVAGPLSLQYGAEILTEGDGNLIADGATTVDAYASLNASGSIEGPVVDNGGINVVPGTGAVSGLFIAGPVTGDGVLGVGGYSSGDDTGVLELGGADATDVAFGSLGARWCSTSRPRSPAPSCPPPSRTSSRSRR